MLQLTAPDGIALSYQADSDILRATWLEDQDLPGLQATYRALLDAALAVGGSCYWLLDMRCRGASPPDVAAWVMQTLLPRLAPALGATPHLAYLSSPVQLQRVRQLDVAPPEPSFFEANFWLGTFLHEAEALDWLVQQQFLNRRRKTAHADLPSRPH
jgi:hypothetical protein